MADNTTINTGTGGDVIATDDLLTLNGGTVSGFKVQRVKVGFGPDSSLRDVDSSNGLPVSGAFSARNPVAGTLSANDAVVAAPIGDGTLVAGTSTAGSVVFATVPDGAQTWIMMIKGYTSGTIYTEASLNSTNGIDGDWVEVKGRRTGTAVGVESTTYSMTSNGIWRGNCSGFTYIRARLIGGGIGATVNFSVSTAMGPTFLNSGIPGGTSVIGGTKLTDGTNNASVKAASTAAVVGDNPVVMTVHPSTASMPIMHTDVMNNGTITTQNLNPNTGVATAGSTVALTIPGKAGLSIQVFGTYTGVLSLQGTLDGTNWVTIGGTTLLNIATGVLSGNIASAIQSIFQTEVAAFAQVRVTALGAVTGSATVSIEASTTAANFTIDSALPAGNNSIGQLNDKIAIAVTPLTAVGNLFSVDTTGYASVSYQSSTGWAGAIAIEGSNDNVNWIGVFGVDTNNTGNIQSITAANRGFIIPTVTRYIRLRVSTYTSGTIGGSANLTRDANSTNVLNTVQVYQYTASAFNATVTPIPITKAVQSTTGFTTQDLKDSGRVITNIATAVTGATAVTAEALLTMVATRDGVAAATNTTQAVTAAKRFRITSISAGLVTTAAAAVSARVVVRLNPTGAAVATSPIIGIMPLAVNAAVINAGDHSVLDFPDGLELSGAMQLGISQVASAATGTLWVSIHGYEY
jgi:hypothetical protein